MATTAQILEWAQRGQAQGYSLQGDLVPLLDEVQNLLYRHECEQTRYINPSTGLPPLLTTTDGTFNYQGPVGMWRVSRVLKKVPNVGDYALENNGINPVENQVEYIDINGNWYYPWQFVKTTDAIGSGRVQIIFSRNPGNTTTTFYLECFIAPTPITSDRIQLSIPDVGGAHRMIVLPALMKLIEGQQNGNYIEAAEYIEQKLKPRFWTILNGGAQGKRQRVTPRPY